MRCAIRTFELALRPLLLLSLTFGSLSSAGVVHAAPVVFFTPVPISAAAIAADPELANAQCWDLRVTVSTNYSVSGLNASLTQGSFYNAPSGADTPLPALWTLFPELRYDTFVTDYATLENDFSFRPPIVLGRYPEAPPPAIFSDTLTSVSWASNLPANSGPGTFIIARLTWSNDAVGIMQGIVYEHFNEPTPFTVAIPIPEPAVGSLVACGVVACGVVVASLRRRRRCGV